MEDKTDILKTTMSKSDLHQKWIETYIVDSKKIYDLVFDEIKKVVFYKEDETILDAGCGNGVNTIRLVNRGFKVVATDFSEEALKLCRQNVSENKYFGKVEIKTEDLLSLKFESDIFDAVLCWGVLMHIFEVEKALDNLCRVIKPDGYLILCEVSQYAPESLIAWVIKKIAPNNNDEIVKSRFGIDYWSDTQAGRILVRKSSIPSYTKYLDSKGFKKVGHIPGQFTQIYTRMGKNILKKMILRFNLFWFKYIKFPNLSREQILIFKKICTNNSNETSHNIL